LKKLLQKILRKAFATRDKQDRSNQISEITDKAKKLFEENENYSDLDVNSQLKNLEKKIVRTDILKNKNRIDGRGLSDVRPSHVKLVYYQEHMVLLCLPEEKHKQLL
jgi:polyribonucleotide nucleotidyltransferase